MREFHPAGPDQATYQIRVQGKLDKRWSDWFDGITMAFERADDDPPVTVLTGTVTDQARLRGILSRLWDSNLTLLSVIRVETHKVDPSKDRAGRE